MIKNKMQTIKWESLSQDQKHILLMYYYRTLTVIGGLDGYLEATWCKRNNLKIDDIPQKVRIKEPREIVSLAYAVINQDLPEHYRH